MTEQQLSPMIVPTRDGYNQWAEVYDQEDNPLILLEQRELAHQLSNVNGLSLIDVGCGTGRVSLSLAESGATVTAIDFSSGMLARARTKPGAEAIDFIEHDLSQRMPFEDNVFDGVVSCLVLEHVEELGSAMREVARICRRGGFLLITAMHPAMNLKGVQARFIDPTTGRRVCPASAQHTISDYVMTGVSAGLSLTHLSEHSVDEELASRSPRGAKYLHWPMLLVLRWQKTGE